jgi:very-short-patch-repair endonuclease
VNGKKFRRQYSIGNYIVDFYCPEKRLAIELDGQVHQSDVVYVHDLEKDAFLKSQNITLLRFENRLIFENLEWVIGKIKKYL